MGDSQKPEGIVCEGDIGMTKMASDDLRSERVNPFPRMCLDAGPGDEGPPGATSHVRRAAASLLAAALGFGMPTSWAISLEAPTPCTKKHPAQEKSSIE